MKEEEPPLPTCVHDPSHCTSIPLERALVSFLQVVERALAKCSVSRDRNLSATSPSWTRMRSEMCVQPGRTVPSKNASMGSMDKMRWISGNISLGRSLGELPWNFTPSVCSEYSDCDSSSDLTATSGVVHPV